MAELTTRGRKALSKSQFAGPDRSYPVDTKGRAANAKARATQAVNAGRMSASEKAKIDAKANKVLHRQTSSAGRELERRLNAKDKK
jgi:hypothetical protein